MSLKKLNKIAAAAEKFTKTGTYVPEESPDEDDSGLLPKANSNNKKPSDKQVAAIKIKDKAKSAK